MPYESWIEKSFHDKGRAEGREEGKAEGREEGRAEGREEGRAEERRNLFESAKRFIADGMSLSKVAEIMRLTPAEISSLSTGA